MKRLITSFFVLLAYCAVAQQQDGSIEIESSQLEINSELVNVNSSVTIDNTTLSWEQFSGEGYKLKFEIETKTGQWDAINNLGQLDYTLLLSGNSGRAVLRGLENGLYIKITLGDAEYKILIDKMIYN